jgi:hypothetical protein
MCTSPLSFAQNKEGTRMSVGHQCGRAVRSFVIISIISMTAAVILRRCPYLFDLFRYIRSSVTHTPRLCHPLSRGLLQRPFSVLVLIVAIITIALARVNTVEHHTQNTGPDLLELLLALLSQLSGDCPHINHHQNAVYETNHY